MSVNHIFLIHLSVEGHLGSFHFLAIVDRAVSLIVEKDVKSFRHILRNSVAGCYGRFIFSFVGVLYTNFQSG